MEHAYNVKEEGICILKQMEKGHISELPYLLLILHLFGIISILLNIKHLKDKFSNKVKINIGC